MLPEGGLFCYLRGQIWESYGDCRFSNATRIFKMLVDEEKAKRWGSELNQIDNPYMSTIFFEKFLNRNGCFNKGAKILDVGSGIGAVPSYFSRKHPDVKFTSSDYHEWKVLEAQEIAFAKGIKGVEFQVLDWYSLPKNLKGVFEGIFNVHTLCCMKDIEKAVTSLLSIEPKWIAFNSLFYEGPLSAHVHIVDHQKPWEGIDSPDGDFNIHSLEIIQEICSKYGYRLCFEPFHPNTSLPRPDDNGRGTFTLKTEISEYTQFSGPIYLPWYFVLIKKTN